MNKQVGFGGGCHWCTEAVFSSLKGIHQTEQGWIASLPPSDAFSEAVKVTYDDTVISLHHLIEVHLHTHSSTGNHSMRHKYRSAVYCFTDDDTKEASKILEDLQADFTQQLITQVLPFAHFKLSLPGHLNYYYSNPGKPFCTLYIHPKLQMLKKNFSQLTNTERTGL